MFLRPRNDLGVTNKVFYALNVFTRSKDVVTNNVLRDQERDWGNLRRSTPPESECPNNNNVFTRSRGGA